MANAFEKLKNTTPVQVVKQKIVSAKTSKRENERSFMLWLDKDLLKELKLKAIEEDSNVKNVIELAIRQYLL